MPDQNTVLSGEGVSLKRVVVAEWLGDGEYGTNVNLYGSTEVSISAASIGAERFGDGSKRLAAYRRLTGATMSISFAGDLTGLGVMMGVDISETGTTPNAIRKFLIREGGMPYFGISGSVDAEDGSVDVVHFFAPKCQINSDSFQIFTVGGGETAEFTTVTVEVTIVADDYYIDGAENEVQHIAVGTPATGTFTLTLGQNTTSALAYNASAAAVQTALRALPVIGADGCSVAAGTPDGYDVTFEGRLANKKLPLITTSSAGGFDGTLAVTRTTAGAEGRSLIAGLYEIEAGYSPALPPLFVAV